MNKLLIILLWLAIGLVSNTGYTATIVTPNAYTATMGPSGINTAINSSTRTLQMQIAASELAGIAVGSSINGLAWRLYSSSTGASGIRNWSDYEITLAQATNSIGGMNSSFLANMLNPVLVRDGALSYDLSGFSNAGTPKPFAPSLSFSTPYTYMGGDLVLLITHTVASGGTLDFLDGLGTSDAGYGSVYRAMSDTTFQATTATTTAQLFTITQFDFTDPMAVPEPDSIALFGIGMVGMMVRRRKPGSWVG